jgi:hypothetical protein
MVARLVAQLADIDLDSARRFTAEHANPVTRKHRGKMRAGDCLGYRGHRTILTRASRDRHDNSARTFFTEETLETEEGLPQRDRHGVVAGPCFTEKK